MPRGDCVGIPPYRAGSEWGGVGILSARQAQLQMKLMKSNEPSLEKPSLYSNQDEGVLSAHRSHRTAPVERHYVPRGLKTQRYMKNDFQNVRLELPVAGQPTAF